jgi:hypothetical protein
MTREDWAQAASEAAPKATANSWMTFRTLPAKIDGFAWIPTNEVLEQLMEDILHPKPTEIRQAIRAEGNQGGTMAKRGPIARHSHNTFYFPAIHSAVVFVSQCARRSLTLS